MFGKKILKSLVVSSLLLSSSAFAADKLTLDTMFTEVIKNDPTLKERLHQFESIANEVDMSKSGYLPTVDLSAKSGVKSKKDWKTGTAVKDNYDYQDISLKVVQNIFDGFGTTHATARDVARAKAAYYKYLEVAQDKLKEAAGAYIDYVREYNVYKITEENIKIHKNIKEKIEDRFNKGYGTKSELERVRGRLSLAISNFVSSKSNYNDAKIKFEKALGRIVPIDELVEPTFKYKLPSTFDEALATANKNNPSIIVASYDFDVAKENIGFAQKDYYPTLDLELEATRYNNIDGTDDAKREDLSAMLVFNYNLFRGGNDKANELKYKKLLNYEVDHQARLLSELKQSLQLSWNAYTMLSEQIDHQKDYQKFTENSKEAYFEEFQLGRRTLIDLLDIQEEINNIRIQTINTKYDILNSKFRILDATGDLYRSFVNNLNENVYSAEAREYIDQ